MKIAVFELGHVGCVTGACLAQMGHTVHGVDISAAKVRVLSSGRSPVLEQADISLVAVGAPSPRDGGVNLDHVTAALEDIGRFMCGAKNSTSLPSAARCRPEQPRTW